MTWDACVDADPRPERHMLVRRPLRDELDAVEKDFGRDVVAAELTADHLSVPGGIGLELEQLRSDQHLDRARTVRVLGRKRPTGFRRRRSRAAPAEVAGADELRRPASGQVDLLGRAS